MKLALALCVALLAVLLQAEHEMSPPIRRAGTRFIPGRPATPRQFPYMAYITSEVNEDDDEPRLCGGSLITRQAVLTEALCVHEYTTYTVRLGSIYRTANDSNAWTVVSVWAVSHPEYKREKYYSNVGIIFLPRKAPLNEHIQPVELLRSAPEETFIGFTGFVTGWGKLIPGGPLSEELRWGEMIVIPNTVCEKFHSEGYVTSQNMCAGSEYSKINHCDSGAPFVIKRKERYLQIGILSGSVGHYNTSTPAIFTRVSSFVEWIRVNTVPNATKNSRQRQSSPRPQPHI